MDEEIESLIKAEAAKLFEKERMNIEKETIKKSWYQIGIILTIISVALPFLMAYDHFYFQDKISKVDEIDKEIKTKSDHIYTLLNAHMLILELKDLGVDSNDQYLLQKLNYHEELLLTEFKTTIHEKEKGRREKNNLVNYHNFYNLYRDTIKSLVVIKLKYLLDVHNHDLKKIEPHFHKGYPLECSPIFYLRVKGIIETINGDIKLATDFFKKSVNIQKTCNLDYLNLAESYFLTADFQKARSALRKLKPSFKNKLEKKAIVPFELLSKLINLHFSDHIEHNSIEDKSTESENKFFISVGLKNLQRYLIKIDKNDQVHLNGDMKGWKNVSKELRDKTIKILDEAHLEKYSAETLPNNTIQKAG